MEVELFKLKADAIDLQCAARSITDLHGMTIVDHCFAARLIVKYQRYQFGINHPHQIDRRLVTTGALTKLWCQFGPLFGACITLIGPMRCRQNC